MSQHKNMVSIKDYKGSFGAVIGDIYGSYYEFQYGPKTAKEDICIHESSSYTDDSVLTIAVADYLHHKFLGEDVSPSKVVQSWAQKYPHAGYGAYFYYTWLHAEDPKPYHSFGNGAAMRVSSVAYYAHSLEECKALAKEVTEITHDHPEGLKGAEVIAVCIYMALHGAPRKKIEEYARGHYDLDLSYEAMIKELGHGQEICQVTVPQALWCFLHSDSFDDCLRLCLHIRWDADTLAAIACPIAEAYYKEIPEEYLLQARRRLAPEMVDVLERIPKEQ